ncbi:hypothetical protein ACQKWADRAFT_289859 [Trichoderma austrokoningii]
MPPIRACDVCFKRKIQCCRPSPNVPCNWCSHQKLACTFSREKKTISTKRNKAKDVERLLQQIKQLESALANAETPSGTNSESSIAAEDRTCGILKSLERDFLPAGQDADRISEDGIHAHIVFVARLFEKNWYHRGMPIISESGLEWIASRTGQDIAALRSYLSLGHYGQSCWKSSPSLQGLSSHGELWNLPDRYLVRDWFNTFSHSTFQILFPSLDKLLFEETVDVVYQPSERMRASHLHISARACFWAVCAVMSHLKVSGKAFSTLSSSICAARAQRFLELSNGPANLYILQASILLYKYQIAIGQYSSAVALHSAACRMVYELNGHSHQPVKCDEIKISLFERRNHHTRKLFWLCYLLDKDLALLSGLPPTLADEYCDVGVPEKCLSHDIFLHEFNDIDTVAWDRAIPFLPGDPPLGLLKDKIFRLLYSPSALRIIDGELLTRIRRLDDELEGWRLSIPQVIRPKLSVPESQCVPPTVTFPSYLRSTQLQLEYHYLLTVVHTPVRRFGAAQGADTSPPAELHSVMHSSIDLSLEASRSTLRLLRDPIAMLKRETFWYSTIHPLVAAMSLFVNILIHPAGRQAVADAKVLDLAPEIAERMRPLAISDCESKGTEQAHQLMAELLKLANATISNAGAIARANNGPSNRDVH